MAMRRQKQQLCCGAAFACAESQALGEPLAKLPCTKEMFFELLQTREAKAKAFAAAENAFGKAEDAQNQEKRSAET